MAVEPPTARLCVLTPEARGAVAVVRVWGPRALAVADAVFRPMRGRALAETAEGFPRIGRVGAGAGDEVVALVVGGDPPEVEIQCHGGPAPLALVVEALAAAGAERRRPVAWVRHDARCPVEATARVDLARAPTLRAAEILLEQAQGALSVEVVGLLALLESGRTAEALAGLDRLHARGALGLRLVSGWSVALAGRPNVGKSRLLNALAGFDRAIVDPNPGTTRDVVTARAAFDGWPVELADTAGLREAGDVVEAAGIDRARARHAGADLTVLVLDRSEPLTETDRRLIAGPAAGLVVANKADLPPAWEPWPGVLNISAERGDGLDGLAAAVARRLVPDPPPAGSGVPFRPAQVRRLASAAEALRQGRPAEAAAGLRCVSA